MPQDRDEKPGPAAKVAPRFDFDDLPRVRPVFILTPEERGAQPAPQKPATATSNETSFERDPENVPQVRPKFRVRTDELGKKRTLLKSASTPAPRKTTGEDWRARTLAERANEPPPQAEEPTRESEAALRAFLDTAEAEPQLEAPLAKNEQDRPE